MRPVPALLTFLTVVFVGGALLAPWLYWAAHWAGQHSQWLEDLTRSPFHRFVTRSFLLVALVGTWPLLRGLDARSWKSVGLAKPPAWRQAGGGFALGFTSLAIVAVLALACGARTLEADVGERWLGRLPSITATAAVVAVLEEVLFRGILFGALRRAHGPATALAGSSVLFAAVHFFQRVKPPEAVTWNSGLSVLPQMLAGFADADVLLPAFLVLTLVGATLALAFHRTGNLWFSIGLHAGWIFWLKYYNVLTDGPPGATTWFWGTNKLYDGWLALLVLAAPAIVVWKLPQAGTHPKHER